MSDTMLMILILFLILLGVYFYTTRNHGYWAKRNVKHDVPLPLFGNHFKNMFGIKNTTKLSAEYYWKYPEEKVVGYYRGNTPELIIKDLDIIKHIMTIDFPHFYKRGLGRNIEVEPLLMNLFHSDDDTWKLLRQRLTPAFTSAKLKNMFPLVVKCAEKLQVVCEEIVSRGGECDVRDLMARFTTDFIGACGFGIEMDAINNELSVFRALGKKMFSRTLRHIIFLGIWELFPEFRGLIHVSQHEIEETIMNLVDTIRKQRNYKPSNRNDFIDLLLELETKGKIRGESLEKKKQDGTPVEIEMEMDLKCMAAQVFVFFGAGFETSSSATSFTLHELAFHPEIQSKIQSEIDEVLSKYDNKLCYDAVTEMNWLDMAFKEALRKHPSLGVLNRECTKQYTIPDLNITIDPGVKIMIPVNAIQNDKKYFEDPSEFRPERFLPEAVHKRHRYSYLPFGEGPRICIGSRLGQMQSLAGLAAILRQFSVEPTAATQRELETVQSINVVQSVKGGVPLRLKYRKNKQL